MAEKSFFQLDDEEIAKSTIVETYPYSFLGAMSIERLLVIWESYINLLEVDYEDSVHEYVHILETRNLLERIMERLSLNGQAKLRQRLEPLDNRYKSITKIIKYPLRGNYERKLWWWYRIPQKFRESRILQMFSTLEFTHEDNKKVKQRIKQLTKSIPLEQRLDFLLSDWVKFVIRVKYGYRLDIYNYSNSLLGRKILEEIFRELSEDGKRELLRILQPLDELFKTYTIPISPDSTSLLKEDEWNLSWLNRIPKQMSKNLKTQFAKLEIFPTEEVE